MDVKSANNLQMPSSAGLGHIKFPVKLGVARSEFKIFKDDIFCKVLFNARFFVLNVQR